MRVEDFVIPEVPIPSRIISANRKKSAARKRAKDRATASGLEAVVGITSSLRSTEVMFKS